MEQYIPIPNNILPEFDENNPVFKIVKDDKQ